MNLGVGPVILIDQSCRSANYRMASTQTECEHIAKELGLKDTSASKRVFNENNCHNQSYYRCFYDHGPSYENVFKIAGLIWNPDCGYNVHYGRSHRNLCMPGM